MSAISENGYQSSLGIEFNGPEGLAVDLDGYVYVTDPGNDRIQKFFPSR